MIFFREFVDCRDICFKHTALFVPINAPSKCVYQNRIGVPYSQKRCRCINTTSKKKGAFFLRMITIIYNLCRNQRTAETIVAIHFLKSALNLRQAFIKLLIYLFNPNKAIEQPRKLHNIRKDRDCQNTFRDIRNIKSKLRKHFTARRKITN